MINAISRDTDDDELYEDYPGQYINGDDLQDPDTVDTGDRRPDSDTRHREGRDDEEPPREACPWCPDFQPETGALTASHGLCSTCCARINAELDQLEGARARVFATTRNSERRTSGRR